MVKDGGYRVAVAGAVVKRPPSRRNNTNTGRLNWAAFLARPETLSDARHGLTTITRLSIQSPKSNATTTRQRSHFA